MAIVHRAELKPTKLELLAAWLPTQAFFEDGGPIDRVATFRLDDPAGEDGVETFIVSSGDRLFHVPMTYRSSPVDDGVLIGEMEHSVLGHRFVYDGPSDPVYVAVTTEAIVTGAQDVDMFFADGTPVPRPEWVARAVGSGDGDARALQGADDFLEGRVATAHQNEEVAIAAGARLARVGVIDGRPGLDLTFDLLGQGGGHAFAGARHAFLIDRIVPGVALGRGLVHE